MPLINIPESLKYKPKPHVKPLNLTSKDLIEYFGPHLMNDFARWRAIENMRFDSNKLEFTEEYTEQTHYPKDMLLCFTIDCFDIDFIPKYSDQTTKLFDPYKYCMEQLLVTYGY